MAPGDLQEVLAGLKSPARVVPDLLVGLGTADDAAVYRLAPDLAIVETVDFFPPVVDDPYTWGAVSAANAMSDVYAMGGEVLFALAVAGFPREMPNAIIAEVFRGGADKVAEAGGVVAGGHTVVDAEPKYGLCVTGRVHPDRLFVKGGLRAGDTLFLSKPLGSGIVTTAAKNDAADEQTVAGAIASMLQLNRGAAAVALQTGVAGATDVTGFGLLGHLGEMVLASHVGVELDAGALPFLPGARALAVAGQFSGGMKRNRRHVEALFGARLSIDPGVPAEVVSMLFEAETSGGLVFSVSAARAAEVVPAFAARGERGWAIGRVVADPVIRVRA
jgi:selenide, water dikinase